MRKRLRRVEDVMNNKSLNSLKVRGNSVVFGKFVVVRTGKNTFRLGEAGGDWIMSGTADEVIARATR